MDLSSLSPTQRAGGQIALAAVLAIAGFVLLLPRPQRRWITGGVAILIAAVAVFGAWLHSTFGNPSPDAVGTGLFVFFSLGALVFGTVLVTQRNPARGAIAFAFVILSTCGLFLLLAAPFLMAVTIVVYAGAVIVTFLFVLMLSQHDGPSDENDRSREPLFGGLAGFAFTGLVLFTLYLTALGEGSVKAADPTTPPPLQRLPAAVLTNDERARLADALAKLDAADEQLSGDLKTGRDARIEYFTEVKNTVAEVVGLSGDEQPDTIKDGSLRLRLEKEAAKARSPAVLFREDQQARAVLGKAADVRKLNWETFKAIQDNLLAANPDGEAAKAAARKLRDEVLLLYGAGELPARNVANLGYLLYSHHLLAVELAGTLLLVATIGAVAIAQRKGVQP